LRTGSRVQKRSHLRERLDFTPGPNCSLRASSIEEARKFLRPRGRTPSKRSISPFSFRLPRAYRLKPVVQREQDALSLLKIGARARSVIVPYSSYLDYVVASRGGAALPIESPDFRVETLGVLASLWARFRLASFVKKRKFLKVDEFSLFSAGPKSERNALPGTTGI
jgi:hypothetical protein